MYKLLATAAATLLVAGLASGPALAGEDNGNGKGRENPPGKDPLKERGPALKLDYDFTRISNVGALQCSATVEDATAETVVIESCEAFRNGSYVGRASGSHQFGNRATTDVWTGNVQPNGTITVCVVAHARLDTGAVLGHYVCG